jgi:hypothetical protein
LRVGGWAAHPPALLRLRLRLWLPALVLLLLLLLLLLHLLQEKTGCWLYLQQTSQRQIC